jgi:transposase
VDVHQKRMTAGVLLRDAAGDGPQERRRVGPMTRDVLELADGLHSSQVTHVALESTGVSWKPVWNILEGACEVVLVNAHHLKAVPGRTTDIQDGQWIADRLPHGLLRGSCVPPPPIRRWRDRTRVRPSFRQDHPTVANRMQKILEEAHIQLASVASDGLGVSERALLAQLLAGEEDATPLADLSRRRLRATLPQMQLALPGRMTDPHRWMLRVLGEPLELLEAQIAQLDGQIHEPVPTHEDAIALCTTIPGIEAVAAANLIAESGVKMDQLPSAPHLASWAGLCPGNHERAGKRLSGTPRTGNAWLRRSLCQAAGAAAHTKAT